MSETRSRFMLLAAATVISIAGWAGTAHADYCVYHVISGFTELSSEIGSGDLICVDCPTGTTTCPGPGGTNFTATIRNGSGTESEGMLRKADANCISCPSQGKSGYTFVSYPKIGLVEDDVDWSTTGGVVRFHLRFRNTADEPSDPTHVDVLVQNSYGVYLQDGPSIWSGDLPPMSPDSFFDVFFDVSLSQLPPPPQTSTPDPCAPGTVWHGNIDVTWSEPGGGGNVNKHTAGIGLTPGGAARYVHLLTGCAGPISWSFGPGCAGFTLSLVNEDFTPAPAMLPPGWTGWIGASAAASVPAGATCCFKLDVVCDFVPAQIDLCARACTEPTPVEKRRWAEVKAFYR